MSLQFNSDKEFINGSQPKIRADDDFTVRVGTGTNEVEVLRTQLDPVSGTPRVGINRTGKKVESIKLLSTGSGYTVLPTVTLSAPTLPGGVQALASAIVDGGFVTAIIVDNPGDGYAAAPTVTITGGNGTGASAEAVLDTVEYELDINGAVRTSTSIISDTARILNLDIENFVTADANFRGPNLKTFQNNSGQIWTANTNLNLNEYRYWQGNVYQVISDGTSGTKTTGSTPPLHEDGSAYNGTVLFNHIGYRVNDPTQPHYGTTGDSGVFPRSVTPLLGDRSTNIATTEYVLNLATNDVGGRIYVSEQIGDDQNDGRSVVAPVKSIKRACQIASQSVGVKETVQIAGGDYKEDNPISIPPDCSIVGDNLRLVIVRPKNPGKHMFKFGDKNYITGITFRDGINDFDGTPEITWDYAMVFDDKQRVYYDRETGGDFPRDFSIGHQILGENRIRASFTGNNGGSALAAGVIIDAVDTVGIAEVLNVSFDETTGVTAYQTGFIDVRVVTGSIPKSANFDYTASGGTIFQFTTGNDVESIRPEGEVVSTNTDYSTSIQISRIDFSLQGDPSVATGGFGGDDDVGGIVFYTNPLFGKANIHDFKEGQEIEIFGLPDSGSPNLAFLNGKQRIYKVLRDADGRSRRFVIPKKFPSETNANYTPPTGAGVRSSEASVTLTLLNSPYKFDNQAPVARRFQDACLLIKNNVDFIADETVKQINDEFAQKWFTVSNISGASFDVNTNPNNFVHTYVSGGTVTYNGTEYSVSNLSYDNATGIGTITTTATIGGLAAGDLVKVENILVSCSQGEKLYPGFTIPGGDSKCYRDVKHFLNAIVRDLEFGSTFHTIEAAERYQAGNQLSYVGNEITETIRALEIARQLAVHAMRNWRTVNGLVGDPIYQAKYSTLTKYFDDTVITATAGNPACADVKSAIDTLAYIFADIISNDSTGTYKDAAYLIDRNAEFIADEALRRTKVQYPSLGLNYADDTKCKRDIQYILRAIRRDLVLGGNAGSVEAGESYFTGTQLTGIPQSELAATIYAFNTARDLAKSAMRNWSENGPTITVTPSTATYNSTSGEVTVTFTTPQYGSGAAGLTRVAFRENAITFNCNSSGGGNFASPSPTDRNNGKSLAITNVFQSGANTTITCNVGPAGTAAGSTHTFVSALADSVVLIYQPSILTTTYTSPIPRFEDWNIALYGTFPLCANVATSIDSSFAIIEDILDGTIAPGGLAKTYGTLYNPTPTYPANVLYDAQGNYVTVRSTWDDLPYIEASPYTQNSSIISFLGGGGALIDGSKVQSPNCPLPGLDNNQNAIYENQGKSMVASAFTIVSKAGTGYKVINDGYTQLVSVFVIFCTDGVLAESGGYASITNSATNFGLYALRARGYRDEAYEFDVGTITAESQTVTLKTQLEVSGLGREPLEHYVVKIDGLKNTNESIEYFIDTVVPLTTSAPYNALITLSDGVGGTSAGFTDIASGNPVSSSALVGKTIRLHRPSIVNSSSHTWEFAGSGTDYNALPENGGVKNEAYEQVNENYGRVYVSGTDELGDFKVGTFAKIENRTGNITFTGTVSISEVEFLKLKGGDVVVTGFDADNNLGGANASNSKIPTQKAVRDFITNNLGPYINKPYSTNAVPRALVELTDSGKISIDQIPALRPFNVYTVADQAERLTLEGALAGDIAIQQDDNSSHILNNDNDSLFLGFSVDTNLAFTIGDLFSGDSTGGIIQATEYRQGVVYTLNITNGGSGYTAPPSVTISGGNPSGTNPVSAAAEATIANGVVVSLKIIASGGYVGGKGYTTTPTVTISNPGGAGITATADAFIESRLYGDIANSIKITDADSIEDSSSPANTVTLTRVVNTSATDANNWVSLSSNTVSVNQLTGPGTISSTLLASNSGAANSFTFLRGDSAYAYTVQSIKGTETRFFVQVDPAGTGVAAGSSTIILKADGSIIKGNTVVSAPGNGIQANTTVNSVLTTGNLTTITLNNPTNATIAAGTILELGRGTSPVLVTSTQTLGNFIEQVVIKDGGTGYNANQTYEDVLLAGSNSGTGLKAILETDANGTVSKVTITDSGSGYLDDFTVTNPAILGAGTGLILLAKTNSVGKNVANVSIDIARAGGAGSTQSSDDYGTVGVARFNKSQFIVDVEGNGSVDLNQGSGSGLDADKLDGQDSGYYLDGFNFDNASIGPTKLKNDTYNIAISQSSAFTLRLATATDALTSNPSPSSFPEGISAYTRNNTADGLVDGGTVHQILSVRPLGTGTSNSSGAKQLAFTDNNNMWIRGSGNNTQSTTTFSSWAKVWTSLNDGTGTGLDADRLDGKQGLWYQKGLNIISDEIFDTRLPEWQSAKAFRDQISVKSYVGNPRYKILHLNNVLSGSTWASGVSVNLYQGSQDVGTFSIAFTVTNNDTNDSSNNYTIIYGTTSTSLANVTGIGTVSDIRSVDNWALWDNVSNTFEAATLTTTGGTALLKLGRKDGTSSSPAIYFNSSTSAATYNAKIEATGGTATTGSGSLNVVVANNNEFKVNSNTIWNAGNITFQSTNVANTAVLRDGSGNFTAGTITANLTGTASGNVAKTGDDMTGSLNLLGASTNLSVGGTATVTGQTTLSSGLTVDGNTLIVDAVNNRVGVGGSPGVELEVFGRIRGGSFAVPTTNTGEAWFGRGSDRTLGTSTLQLGGASATGTKFEIVDRAWSKLMYSFSGEAAANTIVADSSSNVGIGKAPAAGQKLDVNGSIFTNGRIEIASTNDDMLILNATDSSWAYVNYEWNGTRRMYHGLDSSGNFRIQSDNAAYTMTMNNWGSISTDADFIISNAVNDGLRISGTNPTITLQDSNGRTGYVHVDSNNFYILGGPTNAGDTAWAQVANSRWPLQIDLTNNNIQFGGNVDTAAGTLNAQAGLQLKTWSGSTSYTSITHDSWTGSNDYAMLLSGSDPNTYISAKSGFGVFIRGGGNGTTGIKVDSNGYVGIRTESTSSSYACQVGGNINIQGEIYKNGVAFNTLPAQSTQTIGATLKSDGTNAYWAFDATVLYASAFTITRGYTMAGYKDATSYRNVNRLEHSTLTQTDKGNLLSLGDGYCAGAQNLSMYGYVFTTADSWDGTSASVSKINMNNDSNANTTGVQTARNRATLMKRDFTYAFVYGAGSSQPDRFNLSTDSSALISNGNPEGNVNNPAGGHGAEYGWTKKSNGYQFPWANESFIGWNSPPSTDGTNKTISARGNFSYWNTGGGYRTSSPWSKRNSTTGVALASIGKPDCGEESLHTGMTAGYMVGMYNGAQNNQGGIMNYSNDTFAFNNTVNSVGTPGRASGAGTEFGSVASGYTGV